MKKYLILSMLAMVALAFSGGAVAVVKKSSDASPVRAFADSDEARADPVKGEKEDEEKGKGGAKGKGGKGKGKGKGGKGGKGKGDAGYSGGIEPKRPPAE